MARDNTWNEETGQFNPYEDDNRDTVQNSNNVGTGTGVVPPAPPAGAFDRTKFRDMWMSQGASYGGDVDRFIREHPDFSSGVTAVAGNKSGAYRLPTGEALDLVIDKGGSNLAGWTGLGDMQSATSGITPYGDGGSGGGGGGGSAAAAPSAPAGNPQMDAMRKQLFDQLMGRAQQGLNVNANDPIIKGQTDAFSAQQERSRRNYLSALAEREGPNANIGAQTRSTAEHVGQDVGSFQAQLMGRELASRRQEIQDALNAEQGMLTNDQAMSLQRELAMIDDATRRLGLNQSNSQFYSGLGSQNDRFSAQLGFDTDRQAWIQDRVNRGLSTS